MTSVNPTRNDSPLARDVVHSLYSKKRNRVANLNDLLEKQIKHKDKTVTVYFKPYSKTLYMKHGSVREGQARELRIDTLRIFNQPHYSAGDLLKHGLIAERFVDAFTKRKDELIRLFIREWTK